MKKFILSTAILALLSACATCDQHPKACAAATIVMIGTIAALNVKGQTQGHNPHHDISVGGPNCALEPGVCK